MHVLTRLFVSTSGQPMTRKAGLNEEVRDETEAALACIKHGDTSFRTYEEIITVAPNGAVLRSGPVNHSGRHYICAEVFNKAATVQNLETTIADMKSKSATDPVFYKHRIPSMQDALNHVNSLSDDTTFIPNGTYVMALPENSKVFDFKGNQIWPPKAAAPKP